MAAAKPKIDLKARLGRKSGAPSAAPPPAAAPLGSMPPAAAVPASPGPAPVAAPAPVATQPILASQPPAAAPVAKPPMAAPVGGPSITGGASIPPPPGFGRPQGGGTQPIAQSAPVAARSVPAAAVPAQQLAIKMDLGEEVVQAQRANRKKTFILALAAAAVGLGMGFGLGQLVKGNEGAQAALQGAELLVKEIEEANAKITELQDTLKNAASKVKSGEFPSAEIEALGALDIPFDGTNLTNKGIGRFNPMAVTLLLQYANSVQNVEEQRDKVRRLFGALKPHFEAAAQEKDKPQVHWGAVVASGPKGPWVSLQQVKPFEAKNDWPDQLESGKSKVERYSKGDPTKGDPEIFPVDPTSEAAVCPNNISARALSALLELSGSVKGDETPGRETPGLIELGTKVSDQLRKIGSGPS